MTMLNQLIASIKHYKSIVILLLIHCVLWVGISLLTKPSLDSYGDMVENYAWGQTWAWGSHKHPPFIGWVAKVWFSIFPTNAFFYYILSYLNAILGILGILAIARWFYQLATPHIQTVGSQITNRASQTSQNKHTSQTKPTSQPEQIYLLLVTVFSVLSLGYSNLAGKFNADTILLSLWPWVSYFFLCSITKTGKQKWLFTLLLATFAAFSMLAKYYSCVLLLSFLVISLAQPSYRSWYKTAHPYVALVVFVLLLLPHLYWEYQMDFPFTQYVDEKITTGIEFGRMLKYAASGIFYLPLVWAAFFIINKQPKQTAKLANKHPHFLPLLLLSVLPMLMTQVFHLIMHIHLTSHWAIPIWFAVPIILAYLCILSDKSFDLSRMVSAMLKFWVVIAVGGVIYSVVLSTKGDKKFTMARHNMVAAIEQSFHQRFPKQTLSWAAGTWSEVSSLAFFATNHPRALPGMPNEMPALVNPHPSWKQEHGVIFCYANYGQFFDEQNNLNTNCIKQAETWGKQNQLTLIADTINYQPTGWFYLAKPKKQIQVFWYVPK